MHAFSMLLLGGVLLPAQVLGAQADKPQGPGKAAATQGPATQGPATQEPATKPTRVGLVEFDSNGYPLVPEEPVTGRANNPSPASPPPSNERPPAPAVEVRRTSSGFREPVARDQQAERAPLTTAADARSSGRNKPPLASGMEPGSPLLDVFQFVRAPGSWKAIGGVSVWWLVTVYGPQGEVIGYRELTQTADCRYADRDRLEYVNGTSSRVYGRSGATVFAERDGRPQFTAVEAAGHELALFGLQLRMPWAFGDASTYVVVSRDVQTRPEEQLQRAVLERRPPPGLETFGPEVDPRPRDRFELLYEPTSGRPRELVYKFAASGETRRVRFEDWSEFQGIPYPRRRVYFDAEGRTTTTLEIRRMEPANTSERDFRML